MFEVDINLLAVAAAAILSMVVGSLWYSPLLFGKVWEKQEGVCKKPSPGVLALAFLNSCVVALILAYLIELTAVADIVEAMILGAAAWFGFVATTLFSGMIWGQKSFPLYLMTMAHYFVSYVLMSVVITLITYR